MVPSRTGPFWSGWAGACGGRVRECVKERSGGCLACGRAVAVVVEERVGRRWKRGRPFPRAARNFHQPPQLSGSAAAPPALPELTLFPPEPNMKSVSCLGQKGETTNTQTSVGKHFGPVMFTGLRFFYVGKQKGLVLFTDLSICV